MQKDIIFGICADVHHSKDFDERWRLEKFLAEAKERKADFIIQLGDLTSFSDEGREIAKLFNSFEGPHYHVLGNHETEFSDKAAVLEMLGQKDKYYSFDAGDYHFIVLDTNYEKQGDKFYDYNCRRHDFSNCYMNPEQLDWLAKDIDATDKRCFIFMHATCEVGDFGIINKNDFRGVLWKANQRVGYNKVTMVVAGHDHTDEYLYKGGIHYLAVNSMSHKYIGATCTEQNSRAAELKAKHGTLRHATFYKDPLYAFVRLKSNGLIQIIGKQSEYVEYSPLEVHWECAASPQISYREFWMNGYGEL
jgi:3',5'-cyclic AMP phosphodiesterase CpdA